ncbi:hypothetical protein BDV24DRAFT_146651 [Aspergillus arachidicola]|uniref:S-adenosyl-L-methionine-dependent methyltransferase n=1 Tax=Aspergillus arachidicola TaxID=656916 RepID=A0A5N6YQS2_9EURO|nr:hypothetical protein BDV24DRAFT_146651 [Aspergillus arachidicola]
MAELFQVTTDPEIEPDDVHYHDSDSAYNDSLESESYRTSITSSVLNYKYHAYREGEYALPNDEEEQDRMDLLHHTYSLILDGEIHIAPIKNAQRVLIIGTGTGIWAVHFADPIQPKWVPPNCQFEIDDFESEWPYAHHFDYIHGRELAGSIHDFPRLCKQAFAHLRPAPYTKQVVSLVQEASAKFGKSMDNLDTWPAAMKEAGYTDVVCKIVKAPSSPWAKDPKQKEIGRFFQAHQVHSVPAYTNVLLSKILGWSKTEIDILNMHVLRESKNLEVHQYGKLYLIYGRKPL